MPGDGGQRAEGRGRRGVEFRCGACAGAAREAQPRGEQPAGPLPNGIFPARLPMGGRASA